jgi:hypothetical protein
MDLKQAYKILEIPESSSMLEVKQAHRDLAQIWHPDRYSQNERLQARTLEKMKELNAAFDHICQHGDTDRATNFKENESKHEEFTQTTITCQKCGTKNRFPSSIKDSNAKCGKCKCYLFRENKKKQAKKKTSESGAHVRNRDGQFIAYSNGKVMDTKTNLMWAAVDNGKNINWASAKSYCENYRGGGYTDWRMPTTNELAWLWVKTKNYRLTCGDVVQPIRLTSCCPWASETRGSEAAFVLFVSGWHHWGPQSYDDDHRALPVRSGK